MQYSSDFTKVMREAGYIYPFDWRRRRMDRDYVICFARNLIKNVQRRKMKYENNDETVNS